MEKYKALQVLKEVASKNPAIDAMFHDFAMRERARSQVTIRAFYSRMKKQGFKHTSTEYAEGLKVLSKCGFGEIKLNRRGNVVGLFGVKTKLQSIGQAVVGNRKELKNYAPRSKYSPLPASVETPHDKKEILVSLSGIDNLIRVILQDDTVPADRRVAAARELLLEK